MKVLLDTCVLYPSILRSILLGAAQKDFFEPLWSERIIEEWRRAAHRNHNEAEATIEIALLRVNWPKSQVEIGPENKNLLEVPAPLAPGSSPDNLKVFFGFWGGPPPHQLNFQEKS